MAAGQQQQAGVQLDGGEKQQVTKYEIEKLSELRCEVSWDSKVKIKLVSGTAEIFGTEIAQGQWLEFSGGQKFAVFTWHGAKLELDGTPEVVYVEKGNTKHSANKWSLRNFVPLQHCMVSYLNVHAALESRRREALKAAEEEEGSENAAPPKEGPRVIVVGPTDSGKTTLVKILLSYAARLGWTPLFADLDIGQGSLGIPGCMGATPIESPISPTDGILQEALLLFFYGHVTPSVNPELYKVQVKELGALLDSQLAASKETRGSGLFVNTMGWVEGLGLLQDRLFSMLHDKFKSRPAMDVVKLERSGGIVARSSKYRQKSRQNRTRDYFYGPAGELSPHASVASFSDVQVFRLGGGPQAPRSALPIGAESQANPTRPTPVAISRDLVHAVLAVSYAKEADQVLSRNVAGFIYVTDVDISRRKFTYVAPSPGPLPSNVLLVGTLAWVE